MASTTRTSFLTLPKDVRLMIWDHVYPDIKYTPDVCFGTCNIEVRRDEEDDDDPASNHDGWECWGAASDTSSMIVHVDSADQRCPCNDVHFSPLLVCRATYGETAYMLSRAPICANFSSGTIAMPQPQFCHRIETVTLNETVFPLLYNSRPVANLPNLKEVKLPAGLGTGLGLRYPSSIPMHIDHCLRNREGPDALPAADMTDLVRGDLSLLQAWRSCFEFVEELVLDRGIRITSTYEYKVRVWEMFEWPFGPEEREVYHREEFKGTLTWTREGGMTLSDIPDLRDQHWFLEVIEDADWAQRVPAWYEQSNWIDWTMALGGWDLMDLLDRDPGEWNRVLTEVEEISCSFSN